MTDNPIARARELHKKYGKDEGLVRAVDGINLDIAPGETVAVMGPSGCGKSTLLHLLGGLDRPSGGELWLHDRRIDQLSERALAEMRRKEVGFVFQSFHLMEELNAQQNVELPALLAGRSPRAARRRAADLLDQVGLTDRADHLPSALSGGQRQRVAIARALANEPLVVLADEPTGNLDSAATLEVLRLFERLHAVGQTLVIVTHDERIAATLVASWLLALLAIGSLTVLVGGRMAEQSRRVGLLKAVGGTPALVAGVLLAEYLALATVAAGAGLAIGRLAAPLLTNPGTGLLGSAGTPQVTVSTIALVVAVALAVATLATFVPALRAARTSTVGALSGTGRQPRQPAWLIAYSAQFPVPLLLAARLAARRPRRVLLGTLSIAITVSGIVAVLFAHATLAVSQFGTSAGTANPGQFDVGFMSEAARENQVLLIVTIMLVALAAVNAIFITRATVHDSRHASAVARALGTTPGQLTAALSATQVLPALAGALLGIAGGFGLFTAANQAGSASQPPAWWLVAAVLGTIIVVAGLTAIPARAGARLPVAEVLQGDEE